MATSILFSINTKNNMKLEQLENIDLDELSLDDRLKVQQLTKELRKRKLLYPLLDFKRLPHQQELSEAVGAREGPLPKYKYILFI